MALALLLVGCAQTPLVPQIRPEADQSAHRAAAPPTRTETQAVALSDALTPGDQPAQAGSARARPMVQLGTGKFISPPKRQTEAASTSDRSVVLKFEATDLREIIKVVFEDILDRSYLVDPAVQGVVTIHTTQPVSQDAVLPILESILEMNGAALAYDQGVYKVVPKADINKLTLSPGIGRSRASGAVGYGVQVVPLRYVSAKEMKKLLTPYTSDAASIRVDEARNLLILSGYSGRLNHLLETVQTFDVNWLKGMSFGMFPLEYADARTLADELSKVINMGGEGPLSDIFRLIPVERLNSILVITHQPQYIDEARRLIRQFDLGADAAPGRRLYVYQLKHGKADTVAGLLKEIIGEGSLGGSSAEVKTEAAPGVRNNVKPATAFQAPPPVASRGTQNNAGQPAALQKIDKPDLGTGAEGTFPVNTDQVGIIADQDNNAIMVLATPLDYRSIEATIRRLDVPQRQVLIEATIAEVALTNNLSHGVRWFLDGKIGASPIVLGSNTSGAIGGISAEGLSLGIFNNANELRFVFDLLNKESKIKFLSTPHILVVDNKTARFRVGDQIPITTRSSQSVSNPDAPLISEVQYRDTGTLLSVTPRINSGGRVSLEISQEVSRPGAALAGSSNVPITQRTIDSTVVVQSGQTVVLGGLIQENLSVTKDGIPGLMSIPWLGGLFSGNTNDVARTELLITITPRVIENPIQAQEVTEELRRRVKNVTDLEESVLRGAASQNELNKSILERMR